MASCPETGCGVSHNAKKINARCPSGAESPCIKPRQTPLGEVRFVTVLGVPITNRPRQRGMVRWLY